MADQEDLHASLLAQLQEQRAALAELDTLSGNTTHNPELEQIRQDLRAALAEAEQALLDLRSDDVQSQQHPTISQQGSGTDSSQEDSDIDSLQSEVLVPDEELNPAVRGLGAALASDAQAVLQAAAAGPQTETARFAPWEAHTRGIGSSLMAQMGYVQGTGLGSDASGMVQPLQTQLLRGKAGLGTDELNKDQAPGGRKRKRGGQRSKRKKLAGAAMAARNAEKDAELATELATGDAGVFAFINGSLGDSSMAAAEMRRRHESNGETGPVLGDWKGNKSQHPNIRQESPSRKVQAAAREAAGSNHERRALASSQDVLTAMQQKVRHYEEMAARNASDRSIHAQVKAKLKKARDALEKAQADHQSAHAAISNKEKQKKWLKF